MVMRARIRGGDWLDTLVFAAYGIAFGVWFFGMFVAVDTIGTVALWRNVVALALGGCSGVILLTSLCVIVVHWCTGRHDSEIIAHEVEKVPDRAG